MRANITNRTLASLEPQEKAYEVRDTQIKGLLVRVQPTGLMTYYLEYKYGKRIKVGRAEAITPFQAREIARALLSEVYKGEDLTDKRRLSKAKTFKQYLDEDYKTWLEANLRTGTATYQRLVTSFSDFESLKLADITPWMAEKWRHRRINDGVKPTTINRELADIKACLSRAVEWGLIETNPLEKFKLCKVDKCPKVRFLDADEESRLLKALDQREADIRASRASANAHRGERGYPLYPDLSCTAFADYLKPVVIVSILTGLRRGEVFGLRWDDIDFNVSTLTVRAEIAKNGTSRHIPLHEEVLQVLRDWQAQCDTPDGFLFIGKTGKVLHDVRKSWAGVLAKAKITKFRWHDLRHTFASKLVMAGVDLNTVRELLGHSDYQTTLRYAHLAPEHKASAVSKMTLNKGEMVNVG